MDTVECMDIATWTEIYTERKSLLLNNFKKLPEDDFFENQNGHNAGATWQKVSNV